MKEKIICKKDWYLDGKLGYKAGKYYTILKKEIKPYGNGVYLKADFEFRGWFRSGSEYFDVDSVFVSNS